MTPDREKVIKAYEDFVNGYECFCTSDDYEYEMHKAVLALLQEREAMNVDTFMQWCIESHIMGDATVRGIKYWVEKFKEGR